MASPFLTPSSSSQLDQLALLHLRRDSTIPTILRLHDDGNLGYKEGNVTNTRFGSFPHSTLFDQPWGSQIKASKVDTGSRGRPPRQQKKRKATELEESASGTPGGDDDADSNKPTHSKAVAASSGFLHILCPTPELWTASLPHRTQVVYTPDYSYILHRLGVRPGSTIIEAGAGSGSFTHASARAVFNGYPSTSADSTTPSKRRRNGKVCSFEFHAQRAGKVREELIEHGLDSLVQVTHRDVYQDGFLLNDPTTGKPSTSPKANAVFLDLPAPWLALKHLVRNPPSGAESPLDPSTAVHICTFSPCMEQVQRTISALRQHSWLHISMVELQHKRIEVKREKTGLEYEGVRSANVFPRNVEDAVQKMRVVEERSVRFRESLGQDDGAQSDNENSAAANQQNTSDDTDLPIFIPSNFNEGIPAHAQGRLVHRSEPDIKTHTSYLVFAVLPREWSEEDERQCVEKWPSQNVADSAQQPKGKSKKQLRREAKAQEKAQELAEKEKESEVKTEAQVQLEEV
ncbi:tRNA methyltransferase complex GCD14 subunit-domain-containing protein [Aspergillus pseudodeflectus]|uniref:tRNA (adenine(58)-N(1))-methyltransferase catalytic subunit TRM61 n=1 Tax=Aspergillus pseudodeflectus TaxID=176178 RepID=A0ABR4L5L2_9EURO